MEETKEKAGVSLENEDVYMATTFEEFVQVREEMKKRKCTHVRESNLGSKCGFDLHSGLRSQQGSSDGFHLLIGVAFSGYGHKNARWRHQACL